VRILELYKDYHVSHSTEGSKHCRDGWVNIHCPFCSGEKDYHLGYNLNGDYFNCWRCGKHPVSKTLSTILNISSSQAQSIILQYGGVSKRAKTDTKQKTQLREFRYPSGELELLPAHKKYLTNRGFDWEKLERLWGITGTGVAAYLDGIDYSRRILTPIIWNGEVVSFQTRNLREGKDNKFKYLACPQARERIEHQTILYGKQSEWKRTGIAVEGKTDVWRFGVHSFATFGMDFKTQQIRHIVNNFDRVAVVYDPEEQAVKQAVKLVSQLRFRGVEAFRVDVGSDPGAMDQKEADYLVKQIIN
jgi:hypothetical protein